jgi:hypothetical protein
MSLGILLPSPPRDHLPLCSATVRVGAHFLLSFWKILSSLPLRAFFLHRSDSSSHDTMN